MDSDSRGGNHQVAGFDLFIFYHVGKYQGARWLVRRERIWEQNKFSVSAISLINGVILGKLCITSDPSDFSPVKWVE